MCAGRLLSRLNRLIELRHQGGTKGIALSAAVQANTPKTRHRPVEFNHRA
jgi:hypothetical protein